MKNSFKIVLFSLVISTFIMSCDDQMIETYMANVPVYITFEELRSSVNTEGPKDLENPGKIYFYNNYLFVNEYLKGIHVINNTDPASPQNIAFINIPGNVDLAIKDDVLYADNYIDLVALDISDLNQIKEIKRINDIFPYLLPPYDENYRIDEVDYSKGIVIDWELKKISREVKKRNYPVYPWFESADYMLTSYSNGRSGYSSGASSFGVGGSMARFTIKSTVLYIIDSFSLKIVDISDTENMGITGSLYIAWNIETIFPSGNHLFIGSQNGMLIYDISNAYYPIFVSEFRHITSCDPVVVEGNYAYVTLRSGNMCGRSTNQLDVTDISNLKEPTLVKSYAMTEPYGLGIDNSTLFVCDGSAGLKIYDATDVSNISEHRIAQFQDIQTYDVIPLNGVLMLIGKDGLYQYDYSDLSKIYLLSKIEVTN